MSAIERIWYRPNLVSRLLLPFSWLFGSIARRRRGNYLAAVANDTIWRPPAPVIVVGNINVGGTGKTPVVVALVEYLQRLGYQPGVVSRGYGGKPPHLPLAVSAQTPAAQCGDEPLLVHLRTGCPVVIDPDRPRAVQHLLQHAQCNVIVSDDGLQHYALFRDIELAVVDGERGLGNGHYLPAGPLREAPARLAELDAVLINGSGHLHEAPGAFNFSLQPQRFIQVQTGEEQLLTQFDRGDPVHALAGIGNPTRFFASLQGMGFTPITHVFADHHAYSAVDIDFGDDKIVIMTEKDAVKCRGLADERHWYLAVDALLPDEFLTWLAHKLPHCLDQRRA
jgi:tetraacyldisaccharide 4'-kinase